MTYKRVFQVLVLLVVLAIALYAGGQNRAGTAAAPELRIPVGARYVGMAGSAVATARGLEAIYWNPAGVDLAEKTANAMFSYRTWIADMTFNYLAISGKFGFGTLGLSLRTLNIGDIPVTTLLDPDGTGATFSPTYFVAGLTYSKRLTDRISVGANFNVIHESWAQVSATGFALDFGVQYTNLFKVPGLSIGVVVKNIGFPMKYSGSGLWVEAVVPGSERGITFYKIEAAEFELPSVIEIGTSYTANLGEAMSLNLSGAFQNNNFGYDEYRGGLELGFRNLLFVRFGYLLSPEATDQTPNIFQNFTAGVGLNLANVAGLAFSFDYAYVPVKFFSNQHVVAVRVGF